MNADDDRRAFRRIGLTMLAVVVLVSVAIVASVARVGTMLGNLLSVLLILGVAFWVRWEWLHPLEDSQDVPVPYLPVESAEFARAADQAIEVSGG